MIETSLECPLSKVDKDGKLRCMSVSMQYYVGFFCNVEICRKVKSGEIKSI
jgi:hypothetical protein